MLFTKDTFLLEVSRNVFFRGDSEFYMALFFTSAMGQDGVVPLLLHDCVLGDFGVVSNGGFHVVWNELGRYILVPYCCMFCVNTNIYKKTL